jgi:hypothetical protein
MLVYFPYRNAIETAHFTKSDEEPGHVGEVCGGRFGMRPSDGRPSCQSTIQAL